MKRTFTHAALAAALLSCLSQGAYANGINSPAGVNVDIGAGGTRGIITVTPSGGVGIDNPTPGAALDVHGEIKGDPSSNPNNYWSATVFDLAGGTGTLYVKYLDDENSKTDITLADGKVGIGGATTPQFPLDVGGAIRVMGGYGNFSPLSPGALVIGGGGTAPNAGMIAWGNGSGYELDFGPNCEDGDPEPACFGTPGFHPNITFYDNGNIVIDTNSGNSGPTQSSSQSGWLGFGSVPRATIDMAARNDAIILPQGVTALHETMPYVMEGMLRFNTSTGFLEYYSNGNAVNSNPHWEELRGISE